MQTCLSAGASLVAALLVLALPARAATGPLPAATPQIFAPGVISGPANDADPAFASDGNTVVFSRNNTILIAQCSGDGWGQPHIASFSGLWMDQQPSMAPDGSFLVFVSNRPVRPGELKGPSGNLWRVDRQGDGWGAAVHLPANVNRGDSTWAPSVAGDGSLYFIERASAESPFRLWRSQFRDGQYLAPVAQSFGDSRTQDVDPAVAPDESFIVFGSMLPGPNAHERLFIAFRHGTGWGTPIDLGKAVNGSGATDTNEARLGPDGRTLYFSTDRSEPVRFPRTLAQAEIDLARSQRWDNGSQNIWSVSLLPWLTAERAQ
jgi:Tol biopolymer transport system component